MKTLNYKIQTVNSSVEKIDFSDNLPEILNTKLSGEKYNVVAYLDYEVKIGFCTKDKDYNFIFSDNSKIDTKYIQKIRVFNKNEELYLWRSNNSLKGRIRKDSIGTSTEYLDVEQVIFGTDNKSNNDFITLSESKRGIKITLPDNGFEVNEKEKRVAIKTRNYIDYNEIFQATYKDCRFVEFVQLGENK